MTMRMDGDALTLAKDGSVTPQVSKGFTTKIEGGPCRAALLISSFLPSAVSAPPISPSSGRKQRPLPTGRRQANGIDLPGTQNP